jgi:hypothetical protein
MKKMVLFLLLGTACSCLAATPDAPLPTPYAAVISSVHAVIAASTAGDAAAIAAMKEKRKLLGGKYVFSEVSVDAQTLGKVLYHPTPFITGHNVMTTPDADGAYPGKILVQKAKRLSDGQSLWVQYSIKDVVSGEKILRHMYCERFRLAMYCGSLPATHDVQAHIPPVLSH